MKKILALVITLTTFLSIRAQTHTESFSLCDKTYTVTCEQLIGNKIKLTFIKGINDNAASPDSMVTTDIEQFARSFQFFFKNFMGHDDSATCSKHEMDTTLLVYGRRLYLNFLASLTKDADIPIAGVFSIKDSVMVHTKLQYVSRIPNTKFDSSGLHVEELKDTFRKFKVEKVSVEFNNGFIENIKAYVNVNNQIHTFSNPFPIGISSVANFKTYNRRELFDMDSPVYLDKISKHEMRKKIRNELEHGRNETTVRFDSSFSIMLGDLIGYDYYFGVDRRDYSPKNDTLVMNAGEGRILHKEATNRLFEAHIFTDFIGLNENKPNGLIQTEVSKRINVNTLQHLSNRWFYWLARSRGGFQYVEPSITLSKLEQHNKRLELGDLDSIRLNPGSNDTSKFSRNKHRYVTAFDLYQYQSFSAGLDVNLGYLNNHDLKYSITLNAGARLGITSVRDSLTTTSQNTITKTGQVSEYSINTFQFYPTLIFTFLPEERFNLSLKEQLIYIRALNSGVQQLTFDKIDNTKVKLRSSSWLNMLELLMTIQVNPNSKLFGRVRFNSVLNNAQNNFAQVQVGYSTFILGGKP